MHGAGHVTPGSAGVGLTVIITGFVYIDGAVLIQQLHEINKSDSQ